MWIWKVRVVVIIFGEPMCGFHVVLNVVSGRDVAFGITRKLEG